MGFAIKIGAATSLRMPDTWKEKTDDRQQLISILGGAYVQDNGTYDEGAVISCTVTFDPTNFALVKNYWKNRTMVDVFDKFGVDRGNLRVVIKSYEFLDYWQYFKTDLELWAL
jgi:hypothetical protein